MPDSVATPHPSPSISLDASRYELTLGDYWRILIKRRIIILLTFISVLSGTIAYTNSLPPVYEASSSVKISQNQARSALGLDQSYFYGSPNAMAMYESSITNQPVMERVVLRLGLLNAKSKKADLVEKAEEIRGTIEAHGSPDTEILTVTVHHSDPDLCASIANTTAEVFSEVDLLEKTRQARQLRQFVEKQLTFFEENLRSTETKIQEFRESGRAFGIAIGMENRLSQLENERAQLLKQFTEKHPDIGKLDAMIEDAKKNIRGLPSNELELARLQRDLEINDRAYRTMKDKYENARLSEAETVSDVVVVEQASVPEVPIAPKKNLNKMMGALAGILLGVILAFAIESLDTSIGTIEDVERTIRIPVVGVVPYYDSSAQDIQWWRIDRQVIQIIKKRIGAAPNSESLIMNQDTFSTLAEAYRILRTFIEFMLEKQPGEGGKVLMITSTGPQEGKSLTSANLAISLAQAGRKTLLVDADLRRPVVHRLFGLKRNPGLADFLMNMASSNDIKSTMGDILVGEGSNWDRVVATKMLDRLEIIPTGQSTENPAELLASDLMKSFLSDMRKRYDYIILDTPPVLPVTDARTLGILADVTFFIYRSGFTARRSLIRAKEELDLAGVKVKGIILNHATPEVELSNRDYYRYYGEKKRPKTVKNKSATI